MNSTEETFGRALLVLDEVAEHYGYKGIGRTAMSLANEICEQYAQWKSLGSFRLAPQLTQEDGGRQQQQQQQQFQFQIEDRLKYSLSYRYDVPQLKAPAPTFAKEVSELTQSQNPAYKSSVFVCLEDYGKCRKSTARSELCLSLMVLCVAKELIPFVKK